MVCLSRRAAGGGCQSKRDYSPSHPEARFPTPPISNQDWLYDHVIPPFLSCHNNIKVRVIKYLLNKSTFFCLLKSFSSGNFVNFVISRKYPRWLE